MRKIVVALVLMCYGLAAQAAVLLGGPSPGLWWNPNESGRGIAIDLQDGIMVVTTYAYTPQGPATWFISAGSYNFTVSGRVTILSNGDNFSSPFTLTVSFVVEGKPGGFTIATGTLALSAVLGTGPRSAVRPVSRSIPTPAPATSTRSTKTFRRCHRTIRCRTG